jgi:hypothetical protein
MMWLLTRETFTLVCGNLTILKGSRFLSLSFSPPPPPPHFVLPEKVLILELKYNKVKQKIANDL